MLLRSTGTSFSSPNFEQQKGLLSFLL